MKAGPTPSATDRRSCLVIAIREAGLAISAGTQPRLALSRKEVG
jgi:hypothetical protein